MAKRVAVLTSGGDAPGMNAAVRAIVRTGIAHGLDMYGIQDGYAGLIAGKISPLTARDVGGIIQSAGTMLGSARSHDFTTAAGQAEAVRRLKDSSIDAIVVIGGNGSQQGAYALSRMGVRAIGVASTIDNDLSGSDITIGVDTALNIALEAIDRLKVTASSHHRGLLVEVMGRKCGYLALMAGLAGGAEAIVIPEREIDPETLLNLMRSAYERGKKHALVVVAEGAANSADRLAHYCNQQQNRLGFELRATILGHVQRGGVPTAFDRLLATRLGVGAIETLMRGEHGVLMGWVDSAVKTTPLAQVVTQLKILDLSLLDVNGMLAQ
jgi:6-phosphofructokinase 1